MKYYLSVLFFLTFPTLASSQINFLNIVGDVVEFSLVDGKEHQIPQCVSSENAELYAVSLTSESGRAIYSLLITAMASGQLIDVNSSGDCSVSPNIETASSVNITPRIEGEESTRLRWAGFTQTFSGDFSKDINPQKTGGRHCDSSYPGSRLMLWEDFIEIIDTYPNTTNVWMPNSIQSISHSDGEGEIVLFKSGNIGLYPSDSISNSKLSCENWGRNVDSTSYRGTILQKSRLRIELGRCSTKYALACVYDG